MQLSRASLSALCGGERRLQAPPEAEGRAEAVVVHVGVGGFHRAHQQYVLQQCMRHRGPAEERWAVRGVGLMPADARMRDALRAQDWLFTLTLLGGEEGPSGMVLGVMEDMTLVVPGEEAKEGAEEEEGSAAAEAMQEICMDSRVRIVSLTVTEKGYFLNADGVLETGHAAVRADVEAWNAESGTAVPRTALGFLCTLLLRRRTAGLPTATVQSCDNLPMNGNTCRAAVLQFAEAVDPALAEWIRHECAFPNSMVDRITPATEPRHLAMVEEEFGVKDNWPVVAEPFLQWVIEDNFISGRPPWEKSEESVIYTDQIERYENMKLRLLNSSHSVLSYLGYLAGHRLVHEAMADEDVIAYVRGYMAEVVETLEDVPGIDLAEYRDTLIQRFSNEHVRDTIERLNLDGSTKFQSTLAHAVSELQERDAATAPTAVAMGIAAYVRFMSGKDEDGADIAVQDPRIKQLQPLATRICADCDSDETDGSATAALKEFLGVILGAETADWGLFVDAVLDFVRQLMRDGSRVVLRAYREAS